MSANAESMPNTFALLDKLKTELPEIWDQTQVVGRWVWLEFNIPSAREVRTRLKELGFHWNGLRKCWQHPCGISRPRLDGDPRSYYEVQPASDLVMNDAPSAKEYKVVALRECPLPEQMQICDTPETAAEYWRLHVETR